MYFCRWELLESESVDECEQNQFRLNQQPYYSFYSLCDLFIKDQQKIIDEGKLGGKP